MAKYRKSKSMIALPHGNSILYAKHPEELQAGDVAVRVLGIMARTVISDQYIFHVALHSWGPRSADVYVPAASLLSANALRAYLFTRTGILLGWQDGEDTADGWVNWLADRISGPSRPEIKEVQPVITI